MKTPIAILAICALVFPQLGCKSSTTDRLVISLGAVSAASAVAIAVATSLEASEAIDTSTAARIVTYAQSVSEATAKAITELGVSESDRLKATKIVAIFAAVPPVVLADSGGKAAAIVSAIQAAITALTAQLTVVSKSAAASSTTTTQSSLSRQQVEELVKIDAQARQCSREAALWSQAHPLLVAGYMK
jgi:hypothetical protein